MGEEFRGKDDSVLVICQALLDKVAEKLFGKAPDAVEFSCVDEDLFRKELEHLVECLGDGILVQVPVVSKRSFLAVPSVR